ncbi:hypothetical protein GCM10010168_93740 [Actinoplanes ianthinogenes]|nr:hypothetical protein GCM10010168_93740 [Actinoplanes ianthinogenes]
MWDSSIYHACMLELMSFELIPWSNATCMFIIMFKSMFSSCFEKIELFGARVEALKWF